MGSVNQLRYIEQRQSRFAGPLLEVGACDYGNTQPIRRLFAGATYRGVDLQAGPGVDQVVDLADDFTRVDMALAGERFGTIFCLSVLEHCRQPFRMAENLTQLLAPGGHLCLSVPFAFMFHGYPSDYWRFTAEGVRLLFPELEFAAADALWAVPGINAFHPVDTAVGKIEFGTKAHWRKGRIFRGLVAKSVGLLGKAGPLRWLAGTGYVLAPTELFMLGRKPLPAHPS